MDEHKGRLRASELEDSGDLGINPTHNLTMGEIIASRFSRRDSCAVRSPSPRFPPLWHAAPWPPTSSRPGRPRSLFDFKEIEAGIDQTHHVAEGYDAEILIRWGDPVLPGRAGLRSA